jgi:predicted GNAT family N-acyltransferase
MGREKGYGSRVLYPPVVTGRPGLVVVACPPERLTEMFRLRAAVWIHEGANPAAFPEGEWREPRDASRLHWIVIDKNRVVATASLSLHSELADVEEGHVYLEARLSSSGPIAAPARVTIAPEYRGGGLVRALLDAQDAAAVESGATLCVRQASPTLRPLLERRGWIAHGAGPVDPRFPVLFTVMSLRLPR